MASPCPCLRTTAHQHGARPRSHPAARAPCEGPCCKHGDAPPGTVHIRAPFRRQGTCSGKTGRSPRSSAQDSRAPTRHPAEQLRDRGVERLAITPAALLRTPTHEQCSLQLCSGKCAAARLACHPQPCPGGTRTNSVICSLVQQTCDGKTGMLPAARYLACVLRSGMQWQDWHVTTCEGKTGMHLPEHHRIPARRQALQQPSCPASLRGKPLPERIRAPSCARQRVMARPEGPLQLCSGFTCTNRASSRATQAKRDAQPSHGPAALLMIHTPKQCSLQPSSGGCAVLRLACNLQLGSGGTCTNNALCNSVKPTCDDETATSPTALLGIRVPEPRSLQPSSEIRVMVRLAGHQQSGSGFTTK